MKKYFLGRLIALTYLLNSCNVDNNKPIKYLNSYIDTSTLLTYYVKSEIPNTIWEFLKKREKSFYLADSGDIWSANDAILPDSLVPSRKLNLILKNNQIFILTFTKGGFVKKNFMYIFEMKNNNIIGFSDQEISGENFSKSEIINTLILNRFPR